MTLTAMSCPSGGIGNVRDRVETVYASPDVCRSVRLERETDRDQVPAVDSILACLDGRSLRLCGDHGGIGCRGHERGSDLGVPTGPHASTATALLATARSGVAREARIAASPRPDTTADTSLPPTAAQVAPVQPTHEPTTPGACYDRNCSRSRRRLGPYGRRGSRCHRQTQG